MKLRVFDSTNQELQLNDLVMIQDKRNGGLTFYSRVQLINKTLFPFNKFAFDRIVKIDAIPKGCKHVEAKNGMPEYWMNPKAELYLIETNQLEKWRMNVLMFERNSFIQIEEEK